METQINSLISTSKNVHLVTVFGYATKGMPGLEINGMGKMGKTIKEKLIYLTRMRRLSLPLRRYVICVDLNNVDEVLTSQHLKWLEFPILLIYWHLAQIIPIAKLHDCVAKGFVTAQGEINHHSLPSNISEIIGNEFGVQKVENIKHIATSGSLSELYLIDTGLLLESVPQMKSKNYLARDSATPSNLLKIESSLA